MARSSRVKVNTLILDQNLWPRRTLSRPNMRRLAEALRLGRPLPPIIADRKTRTVTDGWHRIKAAVLVFGADAEIDVEWRDYDSEADMFLDAARLNARHGEALSPIDQAFCIERAKELKIEVGAIIDALNLTQARVENIRERRFATGPTGETVILKRSVPHLAGETLTSRQVEANERVGGFPVREYVEQLIAFLEGDLMGEMDDDLLGRMRHLHDLLGRVIVVPV